MNWIPFNSLTNSLKAIQAKHILVIADSCFSGALMTTRASGMTDSDRGSEVWLRRMREKRSRTALTSGGKEPVIDAGGGNHSIFAKSLIDALRDNTMILDGHSLFDQVKRSVVANADQTPKYEIIRKTGHDFGDFLFVPKGGSVIFIDVRAPGPPVHTILRSQSESGQSVSKEDQAQALYEWQRDIRYSTASRTVEQFLERFPVGSHVPDAQRKLEELRARGY